MEGRRAVSFFRELFLAGGVRYWDGKYDRIGWRLGIEMGLRK